MLHPSSHSVPWNALSAKAWAIGSAGAGRSILNTWQFSLQWLILALLHQSFESAGTWLRLLSTDQSHQYNSCWDPAYRFCRKHWLYWPWTKMFLKVEEVGPHEKKYWMVQNEPLCCGFTCWNPQTSALLRTGTSCHIHTMYGYTICQLNF